MKERCLAGIAEALDLTLDQVRYMDYLRPYFIHPSKEQSGFVIIDLDGGEHVIPYWIEDFSKVAQLKGKFQAPIKLS